MSRLSLGCVTINDISIYGSVTSLSSLTTTAFSPVPFRALVMIRVVITMSCFILCLKLILTFSGMVSFSSFVHSKPALSFTINSDLQFRAPRGLLGFQFRYIFMIGKDQCLPHLTPCATPSSSGINVLAQSLPSDQNLYVFPTFVLIAPIRKCILEQEFHGAFTTVIAYSSRVDCPTL